MLPCVAAGVCKLACYHPIRAYRPSGGGPVFFYEVRNSIECWIACGKCRGCRVERARQWTIRCVHEASLYDENSFLTLTYAPGNLPPHGSLCYRDVQLFFKRLRKARGPIRYLCCGEYGEQLQRPHYHVLLFGVGFPDRVRIRKRGSSELFESQELARLWTHGFSSIGAVTAQSARYVAHYSLKKVTGPLAAEHYRRVDPETGELVQLEPEFLRMSLKPGIGARWFEKFSSDVYPRGKVVMNGREVNPPRYYEKRFEQLDPDRAEALQMDREVAMYAKRDDATYERLAVREAVVEAGLKFKKREL